MDYAVCSFVCFLFFCLFVCVFYFFFFFSSRRRHTRWPRDWSSDVCSSDLEAGGKCGGLAEVSPQTHHAKVSRAGVQPRERGERTIGRAVVDKDHLPLSEDRKSVV